MFETITNALVAWAQHVPLELFTFVGSFVEEVLAPIPSPIVMTVTGSIASAQNKAMMYLIVLSVIGAMGKTLGAVLVYYIAAYAEEILVGKFGQFFGVTRQEIEGLGKRFTGSWKDMFFLLFLRALPIMSSAVVSVCSGVIKVRMRTYIIATFLGTVVRDFFYLYVGYTGIETLHHLVDGFDTVESVLQALIGGFILLAIVWILWKRSAAKKA